ncbi:MAG TPA: hypothetical protein VHL57_02470 [Flavobacteriales bacterium]|jgi:hypothetical protein|nr:hypothetical protein [Flavobacteriales bacterium]
MDPEALPLIAKHVVRLLVERRFVELEQASRGVRMSAAEMEAVIDDMDGTPVMPPESSWAKLDATAIRNWPGAFAVTVDLWNAKGRSDLSVELTIHSKNGKPVIEVDNIHVL